MTPPVGWDRMTMCAASVRMSSALKARHARLKSRTVSSSRSSRACHWSATRIFHHKVTAIGPPREYSTTRAADAVANAVIRIRRHIRGLATYQSPLEKQPAVPANAERQNKQGGRVGGINYRGWRPRLVSVCCGIELTFGNGSLASWAGVGAALSSSSDGTKFSVRIPPEGVKGTKFSVRIPPEGVKGTTCSVRTPPEGVKGTKFSVHTPPEGCLKSTVSPLPIQSVNCPWYHLPHHLPPHVRHIRRNLPCPSSAGGLWVAPR
eukprot:1178857-Prorocentrum_minimum.AAC.1